MRIVIKATRMNLTPPLREYIGKKMGALEKFLKRFEEVAEIEIEVEVARTTRHHRKGNVFYAEANARLPDTILRAEESAADIRAALDRVKKTLEQEIAEYKERKATPRKRRAMRGK